MGDPKRARKKIRRPKKRFDKTRIEEEKRMMKKYGLKNKSEIWKAQAYLDKLRKEAKRLILASPEEREEFFHRLRNLGIIKKEEISIDDVLALTVEDILERRLQTIVLKKGLSKTPKHARQLIVHKKILVDGASINVPSYLVKVEEENKIELKKK